MDDIQKEINIIADKVTKFSIKFEEEILNLYEKLKDIHTAYNINHKEDVNYEENMHCLNYCLYLLEDYAEITIERNKKFSFSPEEPEELQKIKNLLTPTEIEHFEYIIKNKSSKQISKEKPGYNENTGNTHRNNIKNKIETNLPEIFEKINNVGDSKQTFYKKLSIYINSL